MILELIGFDARMKWELYSAEWSADRRATYLLDTAVEWPLSVDFDVWPSIFDDPAASAMREDPLREHLLQPDLSDYRQRAIGLWSSVQQLEMSLREVGKERTLCVGIELLSPKGIAREPEWRDRLSGIAHCEPAEVCWPEAGFDVADIGFTSGLSNCGWAKSDEAPLKARWLPHLNHSGLFSNAEAALDFAAELDDREPQHAPFFVFRLAIRSWGE